MRRLFEAFERESKELFLVGGAVRDMALGAQVEELDDLDFCTNALPEESLAICKGAGIPTYELGLEFGTVGAVLRGAPHEGYPKDVQITTYRSKEYYRRGSRHPVVRYGETILDDLGRRDFSINSIAMDAQGRYVDPFDGLSDLERRVLRVVGDPSETLAEDPLRILRIGRFIAKLGFEPDGPLRAAAYERAAFLLDISRERWLQEMNKLVVGLHAPAALRFLHKVRVLGVVLPEVVALVDLHRSSPVHHKDVWEHTLEVLDRAPPTVALRWGALLHDIGKAWTRTVDEGSGQVQFLRHEQQGEMLFEGIARRFTFDNATAAEVAFIIQRHGRITGYDSGWGDAAVRRLVRDLDPYLDTMLTFARADLTTADPQRRAEALDRVDRLEARIRSLEAADALRPQLPRGLGRVLIEALSLEQGPIIGELKAYLEEEILEGRLESGREAGYYVERLKGQPPAFLVG